MMDCQDIEFGKLSIPHELWRKANHGDSSAQLELGMVYFSSDLTKSNRSKTFDWISRSAKQGNLEAQFRLGDLYALGWGTDQCHTSAYDWYTKAAIQGYRKALIRIHNLYQEDLRMYCRGRLNSKDTRSLVATFRDLKEERLSKFKPLLNRAVDYYTNQLEKNRVSDQKDPYILQTMGFIYQHGYGVKKYYSVAIAYYTKAAEKGLVGAQYNLGLLYQQNTNIKFNYRKAFYWYTLAANGGNVASQNCLAYFYEKGLATKMDCQKALQWYTRAASAGYSDAQLTLGTWYRKGQFIDQDFKQAAIWYNLAAKQGNEVAQNCLDLLYRNGKMVVATDDDDADEGVPKYSTEVSRKSRLCSRLRRDIEKIDDPSKIKHFQRLALYAFRGDGNAMFEIGLEYYDGGNFNQNKDTSFKWIRNAANAKCKQARLRIAEMYKQGDITEQDYYKTSTWIKKLAKSKDSVGQYNLGILYKDGLGVRRDMLEASKWFIFSSDQGNSDAMYEMGDMFSLGGHFKTNFKESMNWYQKSAVKGNMNAYYKLGRIYFYGSDVKQDINKGLRLLDLAAKNGHSDTQYFLSESYQEGVNIAQNQSKAHEYYSMISSVDNLSKVFNGIFGCLKPETVRLGRQIASDLFKRAAEKNGDFDENIHRLYNEYRPDIRYNELVNMFIELSKQNIRDIEYNIGYIYEHGIYSRTMEEAFEKNYKSAIEWYSTSATKGDSRAQYRLGMMHEVGKGITKNSAVAIDYYNKSAENNNFDAKYRLACLYLVGYLLPQDTIKAFYLFTDLANIKHLKSRKALMLPNSIGPTFSKNNPFNQDSPITFTEKDQLRMLETMAEQGLVAVQYQLGQVYQMQDNPRTFKWLTLAAQGGISDACYRLGTLYEEGKYTKRNYARAIELYKIAVEGNHEEAIYRLAMIYQFGKGTEINYISAYDLYLRASEMGYGLAFKRLNITRDSFKNANGITEENRFDSMSDEFKQSLLMCEYVANQGNIELQYKVGTVYEDHLTKPNYQKAFKWYKVASSNSHKEAIYRLGLLYEKGLGINLNYEKAFQLYEKAKGLENGNAIFRLAIAYHYGNGVDIDPLKAIYHYMLAASLDNPSSQLELGKLYQKGELVPQNTIEALKWYTKAYSQGYDPARTILYNLYDDIPYEVFFYTKVYKILENIVATRPAFNRSNSCIRLGYWHYQNENFEKAWEYFSKCFTGKFSPPCAPFLRSGFISQEEKVEILNKFEKYEELLHLLNNNILYDLGMMYHKGANIKLRENKTEIRKSEDIHIVNENKYILNGMIIEQDYTKSFFFLEKAAENGDGQAQYQLGVMYQDGHGIEKNIEMAKYYYSKITTSKNGLYAYKIGIQYHCDGPFQNLSEALKNYRISDDIQARTGLGILYQYGCGVEQSYKKALEYYKNGSIFVQRFYLASVLYASQEDIEDYNRAFMLFRKAVNQNFGDSTWRGIFTRRKNDLKDSETSEKYSFKLEPGSVFQGEAYYYLGIMYKNGHGTDQDEARSEECFLKAIEHGNERAKKYFRQILF